jgi:hypothetical protein
VIYARLAVALAALALVAGGCGGDGGKRLTKREFVRQASAVCARYEQRVQSALSGVRPGDQRRLAQSITKALPVIRKGNDELRELRPPTELQDRFDRWLRIADDEVETVEDLRDALRDNDGTAARKAFAELQEKSREQDRLSAQELGLTRCASG